MTILKRRIETIERRSGTPGRLLTIAADARRQANDAMLAEGVEHRPTDTIIRVPRDRNKPPHVRIHEPGLGHLLASIDGRSKHLVKESA